MAMTSYAMPAHLAFNLLWLWCFLRDDRRGDAGAFAFGFAATGLHQILFHPLFVLPFIAEMWFARRRKRVLAYVAAYAAIGLFWASYWHLVLAGAGASGGEASARGLPYLIARVSELIGTFNLSAIALMMLNLLRFLSWNNLALLPLAMLAWPMVRRAEGIARPLAAGIGLMIVTMLVLLPWQGHGWGYRYLHGLAGSLCLLAGYGWSRLAGSEEARRSNALVAVATGASLLLILPLHLKQAHDFVAPYRSAYAEVAASPADVVLVDGAGLLFAEDLVRNAPDLSNRPKILDVQMLDEGELRALCARYRVQLYDRSQARLAGIPEVTARPRPGWAERRRLLNQLGCGAPPASPTRAAS